MEPQIIYEPAPTTHWKTLHPNKCMLLGTQNLNPGEELVLQIKSIEKDQTITGHSGEEKKVSLMWLHKCNVPMVINVTKSTVLKSLYGLEYHKWVGKWIQIYDGEAKAYGGGTTRALCIRQSIPEDPDVDISEYVDKINNASDLDELRAAFLSAPKHIQPKLNRVTNKRKDELS